MKTIAKLFFDWSSNEVSVQLKKGIIDMSKLSNLEPLHASWNIHLYKHLSDNQGIILSGFESALISEALTKASSSLDKVENPFKEE